MKKKSRSTLKEAGNMIASQPYLPDRRPDFVELIIRELSLMMKKGALSPKHYSYATDLAHRMKGILNGIYAGKAHGLRSAVAVVLNMTSRNLK
jgi:hypothetical protein